MIRGPGDVSKLGNGKGYPSGGDRQAHVDGEKGKKKRSWPRWWTRSFATKGHHVDRDEKDVKEV